jgi:2-keto-4-pentenoate hydratase/2-oxohepta-3-ene-1,7-dioic acid hydratase in catechol pathway
VELPRQYADGALASYALAPSKIVCVGVNYRAHAAEMAKPLPSEPLLFLKPPSALIGPEAAIELPAGDYERIDHEAELGVVIGRRARRIRRAAALDYVLGYTSVNDVTVRDLQRRDGQWTRAKGFDTFCPVGPVVRADVDPSALAIAARVNGETRQASTTADLIFDVASLIAFVSHVMTLEPGDILSTGTPSGVGPLRPGDRVEIEIEGIGVLANPVVRRE